MLTEMTYGFRRPRPQTGSAYLDGVLASTVFDLDATIAASYPGTGVTWANLIAAPADGAAQTAYDFYRGDGATSTTYPTFNGSAGSAAAYWSFDGGDYFKIKSGTNTAFLNNLHKTTGGSGNFWIAAALHKTDNTWGTQALFSNVGGAANYKGIEFSTLSTEDFYFAQSNGAGGTSSYTSPGVQTSGDYVVIYSNSTTGYVRLWLNSATATEQALSFAAGTEDAAFPARIGSWGDDTRFLNSETRIYSLALGNEYLDNTKAGALIAALGVRHGRSYV